MLSILCDRAVRLEAFLQLGRRLLGFLALPSLAIVAASSAQAQGAALNQWLDHVEKSLQIPPSAIGLILEPIHTGNPGLQQRFPGQRTPFRWQHRADEAMNPASTIKLLTSFAALQLLGPDFRWTTRWRTTAQPQKDILHGDLVMQGGGDPKLLIEDLRAIAAALKSKGLQDIRGDLLLDASLYAAEVTQALPLDGEWQQPYNVAPIATDLNFRAVKLSWGAAQQPTLDPPLEGLELVDRLRKPNAACKDAAFSFHFEPEFAGVGAPARKLVLEGQWPLSCGRGERYIAYPEPVEFAERLFRAAWLEQGGRWQGHARRADGAAAAAPFELLRWTSTSSLQEVVMDVNKLSNNLLARHLWLQLSAHGSAPASVQASWEQLRHWLHNQRITLPSLLIENGSGLSRHERISPRDLNQILQLVQRLPIASMYQDSLPLAGIDGTMKARLNEPGLRGQLWLKTGTLNQVRALAGYIEARSGQRYSFTLMINHPKAGAARPAVDNLLRVIVATG